MPTKIINYEYLSSSTLESSTREILKTSLVQPMLKYSSVGFTLSMVYSMTPTSALCLSASGPYPGGFWGVCNPPPPPPTISQNAFFQNFLRGTPPNPHITGWSICNPPPPLPFLLVWIRPCASPTFFIPLLFSTRPLMAHVRRNPLDYTIF